MFEDKTQKWDKNKENYSKLKHQLAHQDAIIFIAGQGKVVIDLTGADLYLLADGTWEIK